MGEKTRRKSWLRGVVDFALDRDVAVEIERQQSILEAAPGSARAHLDLAILHVSRRNAGEAIAHCEAALKIDPSFAAAYSKLGEIHISLGDYEQAGRYAVKAAELGDRALLEMFERYPGVASFISKPDDSR
ncbi:MAG TPA: tetratricopeptide repeat protein [Blastocatellia bacterium]|jgi:tetratricopeptide (TPR) repeat protein|nr:tetratricopeptide repeat protein [Blastocatellia bacterium]